MIAGWAVTFLVTTTKTVQAKLVFSDVRKFVGGRCFEVVRAGSNEVQLVAEGTGTLFFWS